MNFLNEDSDGIKRFFILLLKRIIPNRKEIPPKQKMSRGY